MTNLLISITTLNLLLLLRIWMVCGEGEPSETYVDPFPDPALKSEGEVWPIPQKVEYGRENRTIRKGAINIIFQGLRDVDCDILEFAKRTYQKDWFFPQRLISSHTLNGMRLGKIASIIKRNKTCLVIRTNAKCPEKDEYPQQGMNEEYFINVPPGGDAILEAEEVWGVLRGLETFSQLIFQQNGQYYLRTATIHDWPEYPVRGILIDTSRHYLPKRVIIRQLDLMAQNKLNLLHWHIVDSQSFPYISRRYPHLSERGAYTSHHVYTKSGVQEIINHAKMRGIRVMPEFDTPGHMGSWKGELGLLAECRDLKGQIIPSNIIDPTLDRNYKFLKNFFDEVLSVFPEKYIHLGGDEVTVWIDCWRSNPKIKDFMERKGMGDNTTALENYYYQRLTGFYRTVHDDAERKFNSENDCTVATDFLRERSISRLSTREPSYFGVSYSVIYLHTFYRLQNTIAELFGSDKKARMIFWQEVFQFNNPNPDAIAHLWHYNEVELPKAVAHFTSLKYPVIVSSCWYLNYISYGKDYDKYYYCDPRAFNGTSEQKKLVLGGIATVWGEFINSANVETVLCLGQEHQLLLNDFGQVQKRQQTPTTHGLDYMNIGNGPDYCQIEYD